MNDIKKIICLLCAFVMMGSTAYAQSDIRIYVNGMRLNDDVIVSNDRTYVPVRAVSESMGADVLWDGTSRSIFITFTEDEMIAQLVSDVSSSVVSIIGNYNSTGGTSGYNNPTVHGSGVIYSSNGYIITNAHVVEDLRNLTVVLNDGTMLPGVVLYSDKEADLAIVKIDKIGLKPIAMADKNTILSGKTAIAIGTPISMSMRNTVTKGIVCGNDVALSDSYYKLIQTDATVNPGNSGGPLLNTKGELIGINSSKYASVAIDNMAFAVPVDTVQYVITQYERYGRVMRPQLNVTLEQSWEAKIGLPTKKGITVKITSNPLLKVGDVITDVNGIEVRSIADWNEAIKDTYNGQTLDIGITRNGSNIRINVEC
ncbi:MAG: trypsin-like peptidase domain-containing protein [Clostridia bacterium]|nr:trypsin-like peptidase domain-containing protein [Clostridia bacterium]